MNNNLLIETFLKYMRYELNLSACTVSAYRNDLYQLALFLSPGDAEAFDPASATTSDLRAWMVQLGNNGSGPRSIRRKMQAAKS